MAHLFQVGVGSGGIVALDLLARDPRINRVTLIDPDVYQAHNVIRHLFPTAAIGRLKVEAAAEWLRDRRDDLTIDVFPVDATASEHQPAIAAAASTCDLGICAADNEPAKFHFDELMRTYQKPWALGEVLSGGIGGWVHRFVPGGPCYGCVASYLQREPSGDPAAPAPDYSQSDGRPETAIPASRASISAIASWHAIIAADLLPGGNNTKEFTSLLVALCRFPGVFDEPFRTFRFNIPRSLECLICATPAFESYDLDGALDHAFHRLNDD